MKKIIFLLFLTVPVFLFSQTFEIYKGDTINYTDVANLKQGRWLIFNKTKKLSGYEDDQVVEEGKFINGKKEGIWIGYHPNNNKKYEITFTDGLPQGYAVFYYKNGVISEEGLWKINKWVGRYKYYYENGNVAYDFYYGPDGKRVGKQTYYHENGKVMIQGEWADGKETGVLKEYFENGSLKAEKNFTAGKCDHTKTKVYEDPEAKKNETTESTTITNPETKEVKPEQVEVKPAVETDTVITGKTNITVAGKKDMVIGDFSKFTGTTQIKKEGKLVKEGDFVKGKLINGKTYTYDESGNLIRVKIFEEGILVKTINR